MAMLKEPKPKFTKGKEAQGASHFDILEGLGLAEGFWGVEKGQRQNHHCLLGRQMTYTKMLPKLWQMELLEA